MNDYTKPPLGARPVYISSGERIKDLADAISRASCEANNYIGHISTWAEEIILHCRMIEKCLNDDAIHGQIL